MNRREFAALGISGATVALTGALTPVLASSGEPNPKGRLHWYDRIRRVGQTNFNEHDPKHGNVDAWAEFWAAAKVQMVLVNASGAVAYYPTKVPFLPRSPYLQGRDFLGECVTAAKRRGLRVVARMSPDILGIDSAVLDAHPLWFRRNKDGSLQTPTHNTALICQFSDNFAEQQSAIIHELLARYELDGIYTNGFPMLQECYCENCRRIGDPSSEKYKRALADNGVRWTNFCRRTVVAKSPELLYSCNFMPGFSDSVLDQWPLTRKALWYTLDDQFRTAIDQPVWSAAQQVRFARALMGRRTVASATAGYTCSNGTMWRQVSDATVEPLCRMAQAAAAGGAVFLHQLGLEQGFNDDSRWQNVGPPFLRWLAENDRHYENVQSLASVGVVVPSRTISHFRLNSRQSGTDYVQGIYYALLEARVPFDLIEENDLQPQRLAGYDLLVLPNFALMSDAQAEALRNYARAGGSLLSTFETGLYDEYGAPRPDFVLGEVFGVKKTGIARTDHTSFLGRLGRGSMQLIRQHGAAAGFEHTKWIAGPAWTQPVAVLPDAKTVMTYIDPYAIYPTAMVYPKTPFPEQPSMVLRENGKARLAYLAGDMDATLWRFDIPDLSRQIIDTIKWLLRDKVRASVTGEGLIEVIGWRTNGGYAIHLLNYTGPHAFRGFMRSPVNPGAQSLRLTLSDDRPIRRADLLWEKKPVEFHQSGRLLNLTVPKLGLYEVVALEV